jgi:hypothetical protein
MGTGRRRISTAPMPASSLGAELALALAAVPELERVPVEAELERVPVAAELELVPVVAELELVRVEVALGLVRVEVALGLVPVAAELGLVQVVVERELVPVPVALRTKSVTAAHLHGLVPLLAAEDLAAAAETTRGPAATEVAVAWAVADIAVAVAADAAAEE